MKSVFSIRKMMPEQENALAIYRRECKLHQGKAHVILSVSVIYILELIPGLLVWYMHILLDYITSWLLTISIYIAFWEWRSTLT